MNKILNVGIIGCGQIAQIMHLPYLNDSNKYNIYSLCDISKVSLVNVAKKYSVSEERTYTSVHDMVGDKALDVVLVCCRDHYEPALAAAKAGKHVFIEKPLAFNLQQADDIIAAGKASNVKIIVGYMKRYDSGYTYFLSKLQKIKNEVSLARIHDYAGSFDFTTSIYDLYPSSDLTDEQKAKAQQKEDDALLSQIGSERKHLIRAYSRLLGLTSHDTILMRHAFGNDNTVDYATVDGANYVTAILDYGKFKCLFESAFVTNRRTWDEVFQVYSPDCNLTLEFPWPYQKNAPSIVHINENEPDTMINMDKQVISSYEESYRYEWQHFYDCIINDETPVTSAEDARNDIDLMSRIIHAVKL